MISGVVRKFVQGPHELVQLVDNLRSNRLQIFKGTSAV